MDLLKGLGIEVSDEFQQDLNEVMGDIGLPDEESTTPSGEVEDTSSDSDADEIAASDEEDLDPDQSEDEDDSTESEEDESSAEEDIEVITTKEGKKVKIDYSDRDRIKRAHLLAQQGRVWQSERDKAQAELESMRETSVDRDAVLNALEEAKDDIPELFRLITGGEDWDAMIEDEIRQREEIAQLTPEQLDVYNKHRLNERRERELQRREAAWEEKLRQSEETKTKAEQDSQRALINGAFNEYRFAGQLGDKAQEHRLDTMVWRSVVAELNGRDVSESEVREFIKREFDALRSSITNNTRKTAKATQRKRTAKATKKAAAAATKVSSDASFDELLAKGDVGAILSDPNWMDKI